MARSGGHHYKIKDIVKFIEKNGYSCNVCDSIKDIDGELLVISQFTLFGDARKGRRPSFIRAARPEKAIPMYEAAIAKLRETVPVQCGEFGADMQVSLINDGPVTILLDSRRTF